MPERAGATILSEVNRAVCLEADAVCLVSSQRTRPLATLASTPGRMGQLKLAFGVIGVVFAECCSTRDFLAAQSVHRDSVSNYEFTRCEDSSDRR